VGQISNETATPLVMSDSLYVGYWYYSAYNYHVGLYNNVNGAGLWRVGWARLESDHNRRQTWTQTVENDLKLANIHVGLHSAVLYRIDSPKVRYSEGSIVRRFYNPTVSRVNLDWL